MSVPDRAGVWAGRRVLVTGHSGFKGSWLSLWLHSLGAKVTGFALPPPTRPSLFALAGIEGIIERHVEGDVRDAGALYQLVETCQPEVIFHLAAQPLVRLSYREPVETYAANVMGTVHILDAARRVPGVKAILCVTSDKCYENREWVWPYREADPMGGHDPYSSSKGCSELVVSAWRSSFFEGSGPLLASARAGNVIGGGDWADDRLVPDMIRAMLAGRAPTIRSPGAIRPWQHVLEALHGYLMLGARLLQGDRDFAEGWNFGPRDEDARPVSWIVRRLHAAWDEKGPAAAIDTGPQPHEAHLLRLDSSKARSRLGWRPVLPLETALDWIAEWHRAVAGGASAQRVTLDQIARYALLTHGAAMSNARTEMA
ncbi:MAG: CDP-glucose 4,6-dehydratase [Sphingopyxis sp.]|uniref:CDP-glucose 4,6-dehydratase n=1 Tax=Sphingopyxis sp. TaxID=1908224 RepID=UPI002ABAD886|nr:CDP-glucose 4,6-dehydratase [Sphingopyxis sp.]MDZ3833308.1 CDP-glucose 4,6-dehydratase [Sphingopyxis sp.]